MSFQKFKSDAYCVGGKHRSATTKNYVNKTSKSSKVVISSCSISNRNKLMTVSDNTILAEVLGDFFKSLREKGLNISKKFAENVLSNPSRALDMTANFATAAAIMNPKKVLSTLPEVINFYHTYKDLYLGKFGYFMLSKWRKKHENFPQQRHYWKILI